VKLLLDECVDHRFGKELSGYDVTTVHRMGWAGKKNGELLMLAEKHCDVFITTDQNLYFQQNLSKFKIAAVVLSAPTNRLADLKPLVSQLLAALPNIKTGQVVKLSR
jgi:hypothetical protein